MPKAKIMVNLNSTDGCAQIYNINILNVVYPELQLINTKPVIKNQLKSLLGELKKSKVQTILV